MPNKNVSTGMDQYPAFNQQRVQSRLFETEVDSYPLVKSANEALVDTLVNTLHGVAILASDHKLNIHYANHYACEIFALTPDTLLEGKAKLSPSIHKRVVSALKQSDTEFTLQYSVGDSVRTLKVFASTTPANAHQPSGYVLHMHDITDRVLTEYQLRNTEKLLRSLIEASPDFICFKDHKGRWLEANQSGLDLFQIPADQYQFKTDSELASFAHPAQKEAFKHIKQSDEKAWSKAKTYREEQTIPLPHGGSKVFDVVKVPLFHDDGSREGLVTLSRDITERKLAENHLQDRSAMLDALISCDWLLHSSENWHTIVDKVLEQLCLAARFNRGTIFKHGKTHINSTIHSGISSKSGSETSQKAIKGEVIYQWQGLGQPKLGQSLKTIDYQAEDCERWLTTLQQGNPIFNDIKELPLNEQGFLKKHNIESLLIMPLFVDKKLWGVLMIERSVSTQPLYPQELGAVMAISRSLSSAIQRQSTEKRLLQAKIAFDSATEGIMILDINAQVIGVNHGFTEITGFTEEEALGFTPKIFQTADQNVWESLRTKEKLHGEVANQRKNGEPYQEWLTLTVVKDDLGKVSNYVGVFADITEIVHSQKQLHRLVNQDALTGLPNRRLLIELLDQAIKIAGRTGYKIAVLFIDLDRFKTVNDSLGHQLGDQLLLEVSRRIKQSIRTSDVVARLGGDEFMVIMDRLDEIEDAAVVAKKIIHAIQTEFIIQGKEIFIGASVGISVYPNDSREVDGLIKAADIAMYQVKNSGKNNFCFYSSELSENALERFNMETHLRRALERDQFEVFYQPQVCLISGDIIGAEALLRWHHPDLGIVSPAKFIPVAEDTGLIMQMGEWVIRQTVLQASQWKAKGYSFKRVSVNVSGVQILRSNFADTVYGLIIETDCDPSILELEITESTVMQNTQFVIETFDRIKSMGVSLAIDDFGTGYSSLSNLKRLPLDKIKIDQSFVRELPDDQDDAAIANAIYAMASSLGFSVIAEGVETQAQADFLKNMGCTEAQGYLYSKPVTAVEFDKLLSTNKQKQTSRQQEAQHDK